jgi:hypothetical protein
MRPRHAARWVCCFLGLLFQLHSQTPGTDRPIWKGISGKYGIEWTTSALRVKRSDADGPAFDAGADAKAAWARIVQHSNGEPLEAEFTYRLLSVAGPYFTIEQVDYCDCGGAHPTTVKKFRTIQLDRSQSGSPAAASLTEFFPPAAIYKALVADPVVHKALGSETIPTSLKGLLDRLLEETVRVGECEYEFPENMMESFGFYDIRDDSILVRLGLPAAVESCRGQLTQLGLTLVSSEASRTMFLAVKQQHQGLLMADAERPMPLRRYVIQVRARTPPPVTERSTDCAGLNSTA